MKISKQCFDMIKQFEGIRLKAYKAVPTEQYYTIGIGHYGPDVSADMVITEAQAEELFKIDVERFEKHVNNLGLTLNQNQFDALVSFAYNCGPGNLKKLVSGRTLPEIADALLQYNKSGGKVLKGLTRRREAERELFMKKDDNTLGVIIGSARCDANKKLTGDKAGDQTQVSEPDYKGEVSMQVFYVHSKGWYILRPKADEVANGISEAMARACNNPNIGYDQAERLGIVTKGTATTYPTECDCSSLVRVCVKEASGIDPGNFTTANEASLLKATGLFEEKQAYKNGMELFTGDVLVTKTKGHTAVIISGKSRKGKKKDAEKPDMGACPYEQPALDLKFTMIGKEVKWGQWMLNKHGYNLKVDGIFGPKTLEAVKDFQKKKGLKVDGTVGRLTKAALKA